MQLETYLKCVGLFLVRFFGRGKLQHNKPRTSIKLVACKFLLLLGLVGNRCELYGSAVQPPLGEVLETAVKNDTVMPDYDLELLSLGGDYSNAIELLQHLSYIPKHEIPKSLLVKLLGSADELEKALKVLGCLVDVKDLTISVGSTLQDTFLETWKGHHAENLSEIAALCRHYDAYFLTDLNKTLPIYLKGLHDAQSQDNHADIADFSRRLAKITLDLGPPADGLFYATQAINAYSLLNQKKTDVRLHTLESHILKGRYHGLLGHYVDAIRKFLFVYTKYPEARNPQDSNEIQIYKHLGWHFRLLALKTHNFNDFQQEASELDLLFSNLKVFDPDHPGLIPIYVTGNLEWVPDVDAKDYSLTPFKLAKRCFMKSMVLDQTVHGYQNLDTANSYSLLGWFYHDKQNFSLAIKYYQHSILIETKMYSYPHPDVAFSYIQLGICYEKEGIFVEALNAFEKAFHINEVFYPEGHPTLIHNMLLMEQVILLLEKHQPHATK
ncbi:MAG: tetratricopeptide repeat protein [Parachlamydiaceae bacterium]